MIRADELREFRPSVRYPDGKQLGREFRVNIGRKIEGRRWRIDQKQELTDHLRDAMATLKWELYETQPITERKTIPDNAGELYKQDLLRQAQGIYSWEEFENAAYRPEGGRAAAKALM